MDEPMIELLDAVWSSILELGATLDETDWKTPSELPGWTVQDNLSHIIGTERTMRGDPTPDNHPARTDHLRNPIGELNEHWVEHYRERPGAEVLEEFRRLASERLAELAALPAERFDEIGPTPVGQAPFREFLAVRVMDSWIHEQDMRRVLDRPGHQHGDAVDHSVARLVKAMPYVVGKQVGAPDGTSVVFTITRDDDPPMSVVVVVEGRAGLVEQPPPEPSATLAMDLNTFVALTTGRWDPTPTREAQLVRLGGDVDLGAQVVDHLSFMV
jgi:uncharacterized protein (TIGR03083 family)